MNNRRYELAQKSNREGLTREESAEFLELQTTTFQKVAKTFPNLRVVTLQDVKQMEQRLCPPVSISVKS